MSNNALTSLLWKLFTRLPRKAQVVAICLSTAGTIAWWQWGSLPLLGRLETISFQVTQCGMIKVNRALGTLSLASDASLEGYERETGELSQKCVREVDLDVSPREFKAMLKS